MLNSRQSTILDLMWQISALRVIVKFARLELAMRKAGYDPSQPRAPAGSARGGQWIDSGPTAEVPTRVRVAVSAFDNPGLYYVDLEREDIKGGHGFAKARRQKQYATHRIPIALARRKARKSSPSRRIFQFSRRS